MKKYVFSVILVLLAVSLFAQTEADYDKILNGDFSAVAGYYVNENNHRQFFRSDGSQVGIYGTHYRVRNFAKTKGVYTWLIDGYQEGFSVMLFPIGVEVEGIKTDTTKTRISYYGMPSKPNEIYYRESEFPATHTASEDIVLKSSPQSSSETIGTIKKGTVVLWDKGWIDTWNRDSAEKEKWARVYTPDGLVGSCFRDNLVEIIVQKPSAEQALNNLVGEWKGTYNAGQGETGLTLTVFKEGENYRAIFDFYNLPGRTNVDNGKYYMNVSYNPSTGRYDLKGYQWINRPSGYGFADLEGTITGNVFSGPTFNFKVTRN